MAAAARGTMMGNRGGRFHRDDRTLSRRRWASHHWIACELSWKGWYHAPMGKGYTALFFLDEVTALAAGHRPCFLCRRVEARAFLAGRTVDDFDRQLHAERLGTKPVVSASSVPQGAMVALGASTFARKGGHWLRWSFEGYTESVNIADDAEVELLTPLSITAILARNFQPRWHETAQQWDG